MSHVASKQSTVETQTEFELEETGLKNVVEQQLEESEQMVASLKEEVTQLTLQVI